ncbi:serine/threonine protein kinase [Chrysosporum bergii ANA360D]|jgi:serine/threonine-protein kinase|uniref:Serine/threonine protein kinase n=1 Tax=Chrysosporum bergii ANA360D TaxID=617107 RepID=A0AA43KC04_9CYAN|nr:serine/threonine-protein kinase [Chrysosporum bergii]MDH6061004.1 serine/threonine protein kinase [Chrysosporum bergii ANA360D]
MSDPNIGRLLSQRYQLQKLIGSGSMGKVYLAQDILLGGVPVAVKFLSLSIENQKIQFRKRFEQEAKTCALLGQKSIHIVRVMDYGLDENNTPFYVMEYLEGDSLTHIIYQKSLSFPRFLNMVRQICLGLQSAHDGIPVDGMVYPIIHRDIKPSNVLVIQDPSFGELIKILDFGVAKLLQADSDQSKYYLGTMAYSSPEQMDGQELDQRTDIYSLGVMMFEMLTGKMPLSPSTKSFSAWYKTHHHQQPLSFAEAAPNLEIPEPAQSLVMSCLAKLPSDRPQSIGDILQILESLEYDARLHTTSLYSCALEPKKKAKDEFDIVNSACWPANKPIADIVFPKSIRFNGKMLPALWVMLPQEEIVKRLICHVYNQFLFIATPYPMLLWITVIYNRQNGAKWLPYYLDMKTSLGQDIASLIAQAGSYYLLFFAKQAPQRCFQVLESGIDPAQPQRLQQWVAMSKGSEVTANATMSKDLLKSEYEKIKPKILARLETIARDLSAK